MRWPRSTLVCLTCATTALALVGCPKGQDPDEGVAGPASGRAEASSSEAPPVTTSYQLESCAMPDTGMPSFGFRDVELRTRKPGALTDLPELKTSEPLYGAYTYGKGADKVTAYVVLDRSSGDAGACDLVYIDSNVDGSLADEEPIEVSSDLASMIGSDKPWPSVTLIHPSLPNGRIDAGVRYYYMDIGATDSLGFDMPETYMHSLSLDTTIAKQTTVALAGQQMRVLLTDGDGDGDVGDPEGAIQALSPGEDAVWVDLNGDGRLAEGYSDEDQSEHLPGRILAMGGACYTLETNDGGLELRVVVSDEPMGAIAACGEQLRLTLRQTRAPKQLIAALAEPGEPIRLPVGEYKLESATLVHTDATGVWRASGAADATGLQGLLGGRSASGVSVEILEGETAELPVGPPLIAKVDAEVPQQGERRLAKFDLKLIDAAGREWTVEPEGLQEREEPMVRVLDADGKSVHQGKLEYG